MKKSCKIHSPLWRTVSRQFTLVCDVESWAIILENVSKKAADLGTLARSAKQTMVWRATVTVPWGYAKRLLEDPPIPVDVRGIPSPSITTGSKGEKSSVIALIRMRLCGAHRRSGSLSS